MAEHAEFQIELNRMDGFKFEVGFDQPQGAKLVVDEPEPVGGSEGPNPSRLLATAVGHCLSASLLFCFRKAKLEPEALQTTVSGRMERNERGRLRITGLDVVLRVHVPEVEGVRPQRCLALFEDYCIVTASVKQGIPVQVSVFDQHGTCLYDDGACRDPLAAAHPLEASE